MNTVPITPRTKSPEFLRYKRIADGIRSGSIAETPENMRELAEATAAYDALRKATSVEKVITGWWDLPIARSCWQADARDLGGKA